MTLSAKTTCTLKSIVSTYYKPTKYILF